MQTSDVNEAERKIVVEALAAEGALRETLEPRECDWTGYRGDAVRRQRSALRGFKFALPLGLLLWALIAWVIWAATR
jgi:hypothetical protein